MDTVILYMKFPWKLRQEFDGIYSSLHVIAKYCRDLLWCGYAGSSLEVKIETDAMEIKTEADSNDIIEYSHGHIQSTGMFGFMVIHS